MISSSLIYITFCANLISLCFSTAQYHNRSIRHGGSSFMAQEYMTVSGLCDVSTFHAVCFPLGRDCHCKIQNPENTRELFQHVWILNIGNSFNICNPQCWSASRSRASSETPYPLLTHSQCLFSGMPSIL